MTKNAGDVEVSATAAHLKATARYIRAAGAVLRDRGPSLLMGPDAFNAARRADDLLADYLDRLGRRQRASVRFARCVAAQVGQVEASLVFVLPNADPRVVEFVRACSHATRKRAGRPRLGRAALDRRVADAQHDPDVDEREVRRLRKRQRLEEWMDRVHARGESLLMSTEEMPR